MLTLDKIQKSAELLKNVVRKTPLIESPALSTNGKVFLKTENLQITGSFKLRGAYCKISQLTEEEKKRGVIACSAGNHAQGVALAATQAGVSAVVCLPQNAPLAKVEATKAYGAEVVRVNGVYDDAYQRALEIQKETGRVFVHPFDDESIIAGQGTTGLEILEQLPDVDAIVAPIGGGGLISGIAFAAKALKPDIKIYGVQASGAPSMKNAVSHGQIEQLKSVNTIADGIAIKRPSELTFGLCRKYVDQIVTVTDDEISSAILALIEKQKIITEGAGAVSIAAVLSKKIDFYNKKVVCVLSGGNIDVGILSRVINRGLSRAGRLCTMTVEVSDHPGMLQKVCKIVADGGANILSVEHDRSDGHVSVSSCYVRLQMETIDFEHERRINDALENEGLHVRQYS